MDPLLGSGGTIQEQRRPILDHGCSRPGYSLISELASRTFEIVRWKVGDLRSTGDVNSEHGMMS
jgi:hypothetical protein